MNSEKDRLYKERVEWHYLHSTLYFYFKYVSRTYLHINFQFLVHNMNVDIPIDVRSHFFLRSKYVSRIVPFVPNIYVV